MAYQTPLTLAEVINDIDRKKYLLPSIQREFVWSQKQIETLFDSLMRDYPINSFLFWEVPAETNSCVITTSVTAGITLWPTQMAHRMLSQS